MQIYIKLLRHVSLLIHHLQVVHKFKINRNQKWVPVYSVLYTHLTRNYICGNIYPDYITPPYYIVFYHFNNS